MRNIKSYQIARLHPISRSIPPDVDRSVFSIMNHHRSSSCLRNIFDNNEEVRLRKLELKKEKQYNVVGINEFHIYNRIKQKKRKDLKTNQSQQRSYATFSTQKAHTFVQIKDDYLTKEEVLMKQQAKRLKIQKNQFVNEQYMNNSVLTKPRDTADYTFCSSLQQTVNLNDTLPKEQFSLAKLKEKLNTYKRGWRNSRRRETKDNKIVVMREQRLNKYLSEKALNKIQLKNLQLGDLNNISDQPWIQTLRGDYYNSTLKVKQYQIIDPDGLNVNGVSKLEKQKKWVEEKYNEGCFFSLMESQK